MTRRTAILIGIVLELIAVFGLYVPYVYMIENGTEITLRTVPVDPRSLFRGDYVILAYEVGQNLPIFNEYGQPIYFVLEEQDGVYERIGYSFEKPDLTVGQVCLRGVTEYQTASFPSLAQYFVEEATGRAFEEAQTTHHLLVTAVINDDCDSLIKHVTLGAEAPEGEILDPWLREPISIPVEEGNS